MQRRAAVKRVMILTAPLWAMCALQSVSASDMSEQTNLMQPTATTRMDVQRNANLQRWADHAGARPAALQGLQPFVADSIEQTARARYNAFNVSATQSFDEFLQAEAVAAASCSEMKDCLSCYNLSSWCHYCDDGQCHSQGSPYGCLTGTTCYKNVDCVRDEVEYVGVEPPSAAVVTGVMVLLLSTFTCFGCSIMLCNAFTKAHETTVSEPDPSYLELSTIRASYRAPFLRSNDGYTAVNVTEEMDVEAPIVPHISRVKKNLHAVRAATVCYVFCGLVAMLLVVLGAFTIAYAPAYPEMNICNQELDWGSIVQGMSSLKLKADYEILTSVYNPNRASIVVHSAEGVFSHDGTVVGRFEVSEPVTLPGGSVTDILVTTSFTPSVWKSLELNIAYYQGDLILELDARSTASVLLTGLGGQSIYDFVYELNDYFIHVGGKSDRSWCNCPGWG